MEATETKFHLGVKWGEYIFFSFKCLKIVNPFHFIALLCVVLANKILVNLKLEVGTRLNVKKKIN